MSREIIYVEYVLDDHERLAILACFVACATIASCFRWSLPLLALGIAAVVQAHVYAGTSETWPWIAAAMFTLWDYDRLVRTGTQR